MHLFFDTETNGLPRNWKASPFDVDNWPRLVQLAWIIHDRKGNEKEKISRIIKPKGFTIPQEAVAIHGITTEKAKKEGAPLDSVLDEFNAHLKKARVTIAHNISFDENVVQAEFIRMQKQHFFSGVQKICTMKTTTSFCELPGPYGYKWPSLTELHTKLFGKEYSGAHDALADAEACARCYFALKRLNVL